MVNLFAVTGGKGGSGKSTFSIELSIALSKQGKRVLLIDADAGMRCLDMLLGVSENLVFDLSDAVGGRELSSCLLPVKKFGNISLLPAPATVGEPSPEDFGKFIKNIHGKGFEAVVIDLPAGANKPLYQALPVFAKFICICNPNQVSVRDAGVIGNLLRDIGREGRLVINRFERYFVRNSLFDNLDDIINEAGLTLLGIVPESEKLAFAFCTGKFLTKGRDFKAFVRIASRLDGKSVPLPKLKKI